MRNELKSRHLSSWTASSFVIASMIGTGVFTSLGYQLINIQSIFSLMMLWVIGGVIAICGALTYSELATALPRSGGEYHLLTTIMSRPIGFAAGIVSATVGFTAPAVLASMALGNYLHAVIPIFNPTLLAFTVIVIIHLIHMKSVRWGLIFQDSFTIIKVGLILIFIFFGFLNKTPEKISMVPILGDYAKILSPEFAVSLIWVSYAYTGWNSIIYIAGEIKKPKLNISMTMIGSTIFVTVLYLLLNYIFLYTTPIDLMIGQIEIGYISGIEIFGQFGANIIGIGISILLLSTVSSYVYIGPRIMQIMGEDHNTLRFLSYKNNFGVPIKGFLLQLFISIIFIITSSFEQVLMYAGITLILTTIFTVLSLFILRITRPNLHRPYKVLGYPITPIFYLIINGWIIYYSFQESLFESLIGCGIFVFGIIVFYLQRQDRKL
ncbi:MAG: amino acid permease [Candidatus Marinimicrobia bacterium]|nr:amino acid permease [Candidatus Neomarinimicrobiota bacterium]